MRADRQLHHEDEERRYFAEWALRPIESDREVEADRNSYLAGGYSEEFGYHAQPGCSRDVALVDTEAPEQSREWHLQIHGTHPGYPEQPYPLTVEVDVIVEVHREAPLSRGDDEFTHDLGNVVVVADQTLTMRRRRGPLNRIWSRAKAALSSGLRSHVVGLAIVVALVACKPTQPQAPKSSPREPPEPKSFVLDGSSYGDHESSLHSFLRRT